MTLSIYEKSPAFDVINYLWKKLQDSSVMDASDYYLDAFETNIIPIIPIQEQPEIANYLNDKPYMTYDFIGYAQDDEQFFVNEEALMFTIYSPSMAKIMQIVRVFNETFRGYDESARKLQNAPTTSGDFFFYYTRLDGITISGETSRESGRITAEICVCYKYGEPMDYSGEYTNNISYNEEYSEDF